MVNPRWGMSFSCKGISTAYSKGKLKFNSQFFWKNSFPKRKRWQFQGSDSTTNTAVSGFTWLQQKV